MQATEPVAMTKRQQRFLRRLAFFGLVLSFVVLLYGELVPTGIIFGISAALYYFSLGKVDEA